LLRPPKNPLNAHNTKSAPHSACIQPERQLCVPQAACRRSPSETGEPCRQHRQSESPQPSALWRSADEEGWHCSTESEQIILSNGVVLHPKSTNFANLHYNRRNRKRSFGPDLIADGETPEERIYAKSRKDNIEKCPATFLPSWSSGRSAPLGHEKIEVRVPEKSTHAARGCFFAVSFCVVKGIRFCRHGLVVEAPHWGTKRSRFESPRNRHTQHVDVFLLFHFV